MKHLIILLVSATILASCSSIKSTTSSYQSLQMDNSETMRDHYTFHFKKKAGDYLEITEVKLLNDESGMEQIAQFKIMDATAQNVILDVKGRTEFTVVASRPQKPENKVATSAVIVYLDEKDGEKEYYTIKKIEKGE